MGCWAHAQSLAPFSTAPEGPLPAPWRIVGLPGNKVPLAQLDTTVLDGRRVLRLRTDASYGTASHALPPGTQIGPGTTLQWQWRLDLPLASSDLRRKDGDDAALKVCAMFDLPLENLGFVERNLMRLARNRSGEYLPAATLCYVWDTSVPALQTGSVVPNAYTGRLRWMVLNSGTAGAGRWVTHKRDLAADFLHAFGDNSATVPPLLTVVVGADADNTAGASLGFVGDLALVKQ
jgi:Protein of unknown function (DUF3047)